MSHIGIRCAYLVDFKNRECTVHQDHYLEVKDGLISKSEPWGKTPNRTIPNIFIEAIHHIVLPGLVNAHTHLPMTLFRGLADDEPFEKWLFQTIFPLEAKLVTADFVKTGSELAVCELIRGGVTTVCDMYFFPETTAEVLDRAGLRGLVANGILDFPTPDDPKKEGLAFHAFDRMLEKYQCHERIVTALGPHAPYTCGDEILKKVVKIQEKSGVPITTHLSETEKEVADSIAQFGKTPVARFKDLGVLSQNSICAHGVHLTDDDMDLLTKTGASVIHCPESNMKLGAGIAPVRRLLDRGVRMGLGTDGAASNNDLSLFGEMDVAAKLQKLAHHSNTALTAREALWMATLGGATALGLGELTGSLEVGKRADLIAVDVAKPHLQPLYDPVSHLVYSANASDVSTVICDGRVLKHEGLLLTIDENEVFSKVAVMQKRIVEAMTE